MVEILNYSVPQEDLVKWIAGIVIISIIIGLIYVMKLRSDMKTAKQATRAENYVRDDSFELTQNMDYFLYTDLTRVRINRDRDSSR